MAKAIRVHATGGPEAMSARGGGGARARARARSASASRAIGVNFIDVYYRTGLIRRRRCRSRPASEGAGEVVAVGEGVSDFKPGDRVAYASSLGGYAERAHHRREAVVKVPDGDLRRDRRGDDAEGTDGAVPPAPHVLGAGRPDDPVPRRRGRRRAHRLPMGEGSRRHGDRHGRLAGQGGTRPRERLRPRHPLPERGFRRPRQARSPAARCATSSTTASARRPFPPPSIA